MIRRLLAISLLVLIPALGACATDMTGPDDNITLEELGCRLVPLGCDSN